MAPVNAFVKVSATPPPIHRLRVARGVLKSAFLEMGLDIGSPEQFLAEANRRLTETAHTESEAQAEFEAFILLYQKEFKAKGLKQAA